MKVLQKSGMTVLTKIVTMLQDYDQDMDGDDDIAYGGTDCDDLDASVEGLDVDGDGETLVTVIVMMLMQLFSQRRQKPGMTASTKIVTVRMTTIKTVTVKTRMITVVWTATIWMVLPLVMMMVMDTTRVILFQIVMMVMLRFTCATEILDDGIDQDCNGADLTVLGSCLEYYEAADSTYPDGVYDVIDAAGNAYAGTGVTSTVVGHW